MSREFVDIAIDHVVVRKRIRSNDGDLSALESSLREVGLLQPILIDRHNVLISGGRRLAACRNVGLTTVPALRCPVDADSMEALQIQADENLCRLPLSPAEIEREIQVKKAVSAGQGSSWLQKIFTHA